MTLVTLSPISESSSTATSSDLSGWRRCTAVFFHVKTLPSPATTMQPSPSLITGPIRTLTTTARPSTTIIQAYNQYHQPNPNFNSFFGYRADLVGACGRRFPISVSASSGPQVPTASAPLIQSHLGAASRTSTVGQLDTIEEELEKAIYRCRFMAFLGVLGSLIGSILCFIKGCVHVAASFSEYFVNRGKVIMLLVEAIDVYLLGTVMLVFGTGLYELFISHLGHARSLSKSNFEHKSNLFGLFTLKERPKWMNVRSINELKTKLGHVIVMLLLIGFFDKSKKVVIQSPGDLLCLAVSIFLSSGTLFLLTKLTE